MTAQYTAYQQQQLALQQQQQQYQQAAPGTPPGASGSWNTYPPTADQGGYQGSYGQTLPPSALGNGSMGEIPNSQYNVYQQQQQHQLNNNRLNLNAQPFVSNGNPSSSLMAPIPAGFGPSPAGLAREGSQGSVDSTGNPSSPGTPGSKRRHNPYAAVTTPTEDNLVEPNPSNPATISPIGGMSPASPQLNNGSMGHPSQSWGSPISPGMQGGFTQQQGQIAAPLPTSLPQRDGAMRRNKHSGPHQGGAGNNNSFNTASNGPSPAGASTAQTQPVTHDDVLAQVGTYVELARTANGSSFIQAAVREGSDPQNIQTIWSELEPCLSDLFLDAHGCYVIKSVMERLPPQQLTAAVSVMANDPQLVFSMCTHSLHTRRVVQFLLDSMDCPFIFQLLTTHCAEIAMTQQGCIVMQRAMDTATGEAKLELYNAIYGNLLRFCTDPFANYVVQHMLEVGDKATNSQVFRHQFLAHVIELSCNKFASNVMEKALFHLDEQLQHELLMAIYSAGDDVLFRMLQDSFGNYLIQSSIALAQYKDVFFISEKLRPVLQRTPYGHKIEGRLDRRLKGKAVGTRSPMIGATFKANSAGGPQPGGQGGKRGGSGGYSRQQPRQTSPAGQSSASSFSGNSDDAVEEPW